MTKIKKLEAILSVLENANGFHIYSFIKQHKFLNELSLANNILRKKSCSLLGLNKRDSNKIYTILNK